MKRVNILFLVIFSLFIFGCAENESADFYYIKNNSTYPVDVHYGIGNSETVKQDETKLYHTTNCNYTLDYEKSVGTPENFETKKTVSIKLVNATEKKGFHNGDYCNIVEFSDNTEYKKDFKVLYTITNNLTLSDITVKFSYFGENKTITIPKKTDTPNANVKTLTFEWKDVDLHFFKGTEEIDIKESDSGVQCIKE